MRIRITLQREPLLPVPTIFPNPCKRCGAKVEFWGVVRGEEKGAEISHLDYESYPEMAEHQIRKILEELRLHHPCHSVEVWHRLGRVPVGEASLFISITSAHRKEAFAMLAEFCDRLKQDVPIWKSV